MKDIVMPVNADHLEQLLIESKYNEEETKFLVNGFRQGFDIGYEGPTGRKDTSENIPIREVGSQEEMWDKLLKEVELGRYVGPFDQIPFKDEFIQSPIGLVSKAGNKTRLIFHLSHNFKKTGNKLVNFYIPKGKCLAKYNDLDTAVKYCIRML